MELTSANFRKASENGDDKDLPHSFILPAKSTVEEEKMSTPKLRELLRYFLAEMLGTFLLVVFGDGSIAQVVIGSKTVQPSTFFSNFQSIALGYGLALMIGIAASGGVSGGHLNPAVTLGMAVLKKCHWIKVPVYMAGQYIGAFLAAVAIYAVYYDGISAVNDDSVTRGIFASYPNGAFPLSTLTLAYDQILGTALLMIVILAVTDSNNMNVASGLVPLLIGLGLTAIHISFGLNAGSAINPARDFSPRLLTLIAGYGSAPFEAGDYFFWIPWLLPHVGGVIGAFLYKVMIDLHHPAENNTVI